MNQEKVQMSSGHLEFLDITQASMETWEFIVERR